MQRHLFFFDSPSQRSNLLKRSLIICLSLFHLFSIDAIIRSEEEDMEDFEQEEPFDEEQNFQSNNFRTRISNGIDWLLGSTIVLLLGHKAYNYWEKDQDKPVLNNNFDLDAKEEMFS